MKKIFATMALAALMLPAVCKAQQDPVAFEINGQKITKSEFMKDFLRSQSRTDVKQMSNTEKREALNEYAQLFANYRAKLTDAYAIGLDTLTALNEELKQYRDELAAPYLIDSATMEDILREAYERNHYAVHAAHILIRCGAGASAEDTLKAYQTAMKYYEKAVAGEDFVRLAQKAVDEQRRKVAGEIYTPNPNEGDLNCFTVFDMVYPFENAAYSIEPGTVGKPIRTRYGYHVIKVYDRVPYYGKAKLSHIWVRDAVNAGKAEARIKMAYEGLKNGESFAAMARQHSDDVNTNLSGGVLGEMELKQMPPDYVVEISKGLKVGEYSKPFRTQYGWHIILLQSKEEIPPYEDMVNTYKQRLSRDQRSKNPRAIYAANAKQRYNFVDYTKEFEKNKKGKTTKTPMASLDELKGMVTDSVFYARLELNLDDIKDLRPIMRLAGKEYTQRDLAKYILEKQAKEQKYDIAMYVEHKYNEFIDNEAITYADVHLEEENAEFAALVEEYRHGMMIFSYNERMIWGLAVKDTTGFEQFYEREVKTKKMDNPDDQAYFWNTRARVKVIIVNDSATIDPAKAMKIAQKAVKKNWTLQTIDNAFRDAAATKEADAVSLSLEVIEKDKGLNNSKPGATTKSLLNENEWQTGLYIHGNEKGYSIIQVESIIPPSAKSSKEARGYYMNDYQNYLEKQLNDNLRKKYNVKIHQEVIDSLTY